MAEKRARILFGANFFYDDSVPNRVYSGTQCTTLDRNGAVHFSGSLSLLMFFRPFRLASGQFSIFFSSKFWFPGTECQKSSL